ncbi:double-strand break repair helicase AddA [Temperatibacter marinus]|uniref:DNA 3'-5' helicase n=1 Tax=Temperatibacter marinus TaxID=1456591 RepID=A0AA52EK31_9PROT|nr:double-strand break repair helicase AddA [Temperatibacter marinus]WND03934.1 double-strand break repair helicase AddA [Temperatibacter marinus]
MVKMSPEQAMATHPETTVWVGASAGTGKTHVLTARVLRLMVGGTAPGNILCLTFTKAAAAEMKTRIFRELGAWAVMNDVQLKSALKRRVDEEASPEVLARARRLFAEVLDLSGGLQILTFHSFCQSLLGRFPLEAGIAPGFEALDDQMAATVKLEARDRVLKSNVEQSALSEVAKRVNEADFDRVMEGLMHKGIEVQKLLKSHGKIGLRSALLRHFNFDPQQSTQLLIESSVKDESFSLEGLKELLVCFTSGSKKEQAIAGQIESFLKAEETERTRYFSDYKYGFLTKTGAAPLKNIPTKKTSEKATHLVEIYQEEQERLYVLNQKLLTLEMIDATTALLTLGFDQIDAYRTLKQARGVVDFDDMINSTVSLLAGSGAASWILYKLDGGIDHILVDEAQDTNANQWDVVETLASDFYSGEGAREEQVGQDAASHFARTVFAVGDVKQSIYSFQNADPKEFIAARSRVFNRAENAQMAYGQIPLNQSFRSGGAVLTLVDQVFRQGGRGYPGVTSDEEEIKHDYHRQGYAGSVELWPLEIEEVTEEKSDADKETWQAPIAQEEASDSEQKTAWKVARHIADQIKNEHRLEAKGRPIRPSDILVIVRKRSRFVEQLTRALKILDIPVSGRDRIQLASEAPVMDLLSLMRFMLQPEDDLSLAEVLTGPFAGLTQEALFDLAYERPVSLWQQLVSRRSERPEYQKIYDFLSACLNEVDRGTPFDFLMTLLNEFDGRKKLVHRLGEECHDALDEMLDMALTFERLNSPSLQSFLHAFEQTDVTIKRDMEEAGNSVRIMTAHGSKGLQAPIVYLPDTTSVPEIGRDTALLTKGSQESAESWLLWTSGIKNLSLVDDLKAQHKIEMMAEYRRLLYVAMTRAEDHLFITGWQKKRKISEDCWYELIKEGFEAIEGSFTRQDSEGESLCFAVPQKSPIDTSESKTSVKQIHEVPNWAKNVMPEEPTPSRPLVPSRPDHDEPAARSPLSRVTDRPFQRGNLIHSLLEWLPELSSDMRGKATIEYLAHPGHNLSQTQQKKMGQEVLSILEDQDFADLFSPQSRAEVPIAGLLSNGHVISGQVDRLVVTEESVKIVDYKTNQPAPRSAQDVPEAYQRQMALYRLALEDIYPDKKVKCYLLWTDILTIMEV